MRRHLPRPRHSPGGPCSRWQSARPDEGWRIKQEDRDGATALTALPDAPLPLAAAVLLCMAPDGYRTAAGQSALLKSYAGAMAAAAARSLADDVQHNPPPAATSSPRGRRRNRRRPTLREDPAPPHSDRRLKSWAPLRLRRRPAYPPRRGQAWMRFGAATPGACAAGRPSFHASRGARRAGVCSRLRSDYANSTGDVAATSRAWKLFLLAPRMLLARAAQQGAEGRAELVARAAAFERGDWTRLLREARANSGKPNPARPAQDAETLELGRQRRARVKVRMGELTRARHVLTAADLAPGMRRPTGPSRTPERRPPEPRTAIPAAALQYEPAQPVRLPANAVAAALRDARRGGAAGACVRST